jgi:TRAP-type C4-dicarboxylate transport system permease small subunit
MDLIDRAAERVAQGLALVGALGLIAMLVHVSADVLSRNLFGRPVPATNEIVSRYWMVGIAFLPLAWVERGRAMISVELVDMLLTERLRRLSDALIAALATAIYGAIAWVTWADAAEAWESGRFVDVLGREVPVWPTYFLVPAGFALAAFVTLARVLAVARGTGR